MRSSYSRLLLLPLCAFIIALAPFDPRLVGAQAEAWEPLGLSQAVRLYAPTSGALLAATTTGLFRSDDAGASWLEVTLPEGSLDMEQIAVDPLDQRVVYVPGKQGLYKTDDGAVTWNRILETDGTLRGIALSSAAPGLVYVSLADKLEPTHLRQFLVSHDAGTSWTEQEHVEFRGNAREFCNWRLTLLSAHRSVVGRVFRAWFCEGGSRTPVLQQSDDDGLTWTENLVLPVFAQHMASSRAPSGERLYLTGYREPRMGGAAALVSADGGASWSTILAFGVDGNNMDDALLGMGGLAVDPSDPMTIWIALNRTNSRTAPPTYTGEVVTSRNGGTTWNSLAVGALPKIHDLVLGIDGQNIYAATEAGVYRLRIG